MDFLTVGKLIGNILGRMERVLRKQKDLSNIKRLIICGTTQT